MSPGPWIPQSCSRPVSRSWPVPTWHWVRLGITSDLCASCGASPSGDPVLLYLFPYPPLAVVPLLCPRVAGGRTQLPEASVYLSRLQSCCGVRGLWGGHLSRASHQDSLGHLSGLGAEVDRRPVRLWLAHEHSLLTRRWMVLESSRVVFFGIIKLLREEEI